MSLESLFAVSKPVIAMVHVEALPGTPAHSRPLSAIIDKAVMEASIYHKAGVHGLMIENMHDTPYERGRVGPEIVASMTAIAGAIKRAVPLPCGIQVLAAANQEAMAVALAAGLQFIRAEGFTFAHVADEGLIESCAAGLLRYRKAIGAGSIQVWADIKKKHSAHAITADVGIGETAHAAEFMRADAVIVTGTVTGDAPKHTDVTEVKQHTRLPVLLGSGVSRKNLRAFVPVADGFIVGSEFKVNGDWSEEIDVHRVSQFMSEYHQVQTGN